MEEQLHILLIEDDEGIAEVYRFRLALDGYLVTVAGDGEQGLQQAAAVSPDLIFLDLRLPNMSGIEVLRRLRADPATSAIPVVIVTNYDEPDLRSQGLSLGALEFLVKADTIPAQLSEAADRWTARDTADTSPN
ncbi:MAG: response regulator [Candidatus Dormibacteraeota bacterium]|nr:response regulator [Candidatus Dormibacteraeota bacterium]